MTEADQTQFEVGVRAVRDERMAEAETYFQQVLAGNPDHAPALYNLAAIKYQDGKSDQAEDLLSKALHLRPGHVVNGIRRRLSKLFSGDDPRQPGYRHSV